MKKMMLLIFFSALVVLFVPSKGTKAKTMVDPEYGYYWIHSMLDNGKVIDVAGGGFANGTNLQVWQQESYDGSKINTNQIFYIKPNSDGTISFHNIKTDAAIDSLEATTGKKLIRKGEKANVGLWRRDNGSSNQKYKLIDIKQDYVSDSFTATIALGADTGYVLNVEASTRFNICNGTNVTLAPADGSDSQRFVFERLTPEEVEKSLSIAYSERDAMCLEIVSNAWKTIGLSFDYKDIAAVIENAGKGVKNYGVDVNNCCNFVHEMFGIVGIKFNRPGNCGNLIRSLLANTGTTFYSIKDKPASNGKTRWNYGSCKSEYNWVYDPEYIPREGDIAFFRWSDAGYNSFSHVGIVVDYNEGGYRKGHKDEIITIESNTSGVYGSHQLAFKIRERKANVIGYLSLHKR